MNKKNKIIGSIVIVCVFLIFAIIGLFKYFQEVNNNSEDIFVESKPLTSTSSTQASSNYSVNSKYIEVEIKGEVKKPGVYTMSYGSRLEDLILKSGGFTEKADKNNIPSLAKKLRDEECIVIYNIEGSTNKNASNTNTGNAAQAQAQENSDIININTANEEELEKIPGVGPTIAKAIVEYREKNGAFNTIEDIKNVDRIGDKTFEKMKDKITV